MREAEFLRQIFSLLDTNVVGLQAEQKHALLQAIWAEVEPAGHLPTCPVVPFITGRRPVDEAAYPGLGSSDNTALILSAAAPGTNKSYILYQIVGLEQYSENELTHLSLDVTLSLAGTDGSLETLPLPGWNKRPLEPLVFRPNSTGKPTLEPISLAEVKDAHLVLVLQPNQDFLPGEAWAWSTIDEQIQATATDEADPFTFGHLFSQMLHVTIRLTHRGVPAAASQAWLDVCDTRRFGSLYQRIVDKLIKPDTARQAQAAGKVGLDHAYHPWFPVLLIGSDKAALYTDALVEDIVHKKRHLTDPRWLMRVGLYLEFLTCLGIFEAVKDDMGDLLTPAERTIYETSPFFAEIRQRLNPAGWREVWNLREMSFSRFGVPQTGPVSFLNLLQKRKATLAFLDVHHNDLKHAIAMAGQNEHNAQETWYRVFRDAERAVLRQTTDAFPELAFVDAQVKEFILWHQKGKIDVTGMRWIPKQISSLFGDQDGLFASACTQYRASMNEVAEWARHQHLMDFIGHECVPEQVSLLRTHMEGQQGQFERLQLRDGYTGNLNPITRRLDEENPSVTRVREMLAQSPLFSMLTAAELDQLAAASRQITLGPLERIIIEGREGSSLFLISEGQMEVFVRQADKADRLVDVRQPGDMVGELSMLTGARRSATVRAKDGAVVYEIGKRQYGPIVRARPAIIDELVIVMERNLDNIRQHRQAHNSVHVEMPALGQRIWRYLVGTGV
ncbi:MAG: cyclic nucleotide-binding domain-containing protein [Chloroflexi bacterium]|nr:cyclic nucleotide-binding domain-containing protein [Chloroflexota bacterium]